MSGLVRVGIRVTPLTLAYVARFAEDLVKGALGEGVPQQKFVTETVLLGHIFIQFYISCDPRYGRPPCIIAEMGHQFSAWLLQSLTAA